MTDTGLQKRAGWTGLLKKPHAPALLALCFAVWLHAADAMLVATMLPDIVRDLDGAPYAAWSVVLYEIGSIVVGSVSAFFATRHGIRHVMIVCALIFASGCLVSAIAPAMPLFLVGRAIQGLGGGGLTALSFIAIGSHFSGALMGPAIAIISALWGAASFLAPFLGGVIVEFFNWHAGMYLFALQGLTLALWLRLRPGTISSRSAPAGDRRIPYWRLLYLALGVLSISYAGVGGSPAHTVGFIILGLLILISFLRRDMASTASRMLPRRAFSLKTPTGAVLLMHFTMSIAMMGMVTYGPMFLQVLHGASPMAGGYALAFNAVGWTIGAILVANVEEHRDRFCVAAGMCLVAASIAGFVYAVPNGPLSLVAFCGTLEGIGFGVAWTSMMRRARALAEADDAERTMGALPTVARLGFAIGAATTGILANAGGFSLDAPRDVQVFAAYLVYAGGLPFAIIGLIATWRFVRPVRPAGSTGR